MYLKCIKFLILADDQCSDLRALKHPALILITAGSNFQTIWLKAVKLCSCLLQGVCFPLLLFMRYCAGMFFVHVTLCNLWGASEPPCPRSWNAVSSGELGHPHLHFDIRNNNKFKKPPKNNSFMLLVALKFSPFFNFCRVMWPTDYAQ